MQQACKRQNQAECAYKVISAPGSWSGSLSKQKAPLVQCPLKVPNKLKEYNHQWVSKML